VAARPVASRVILSSIELVNDAVASCLLVANKFKPMENHIISFMRLIWHPFDCLHGMWGYNQCRKLLRHEAVTEVRTATPIFSAPDMESGVAA
jgi:hypothetical protein